jgi:diguanylate cyclase (GGDEF)-like protein/PAS domain S-box-containing protein
LELNLENYLSLYIEESLKALSLTERALSSFENLAADTEKISLIFRNFHSLKSNSAAFNFDKISKLAGLIEFFLDPIKHGKKVLTPANVELLRKATHCIQEMLVAIQNNRKIDESHIKRIIAKFGFLIKNPAHLYNDHLTEGQGTSYGLPSSEIEKSFTLLDPQKAPMIWGDNKDSLAEIETTSSFKKKKGKQSLILVIDDDKINRSILEDWLIKKNYRVLTAENGDQAIELIQQHDNIDVILLDIIMPKTDGYQVLHYIRMNKIYKDIPVIMISALGEMNGIVRCIEEGAEDYLIKPFNSFLLSARINASIEKKKLRDAEKAYRKKLVTEKNYIESIINSMSNMLVVSNKNFIIQRVNPATINILGYKEEELVGKNLFTIFGAKKDQNENRKLLSSPPQALSSMENYLRTKDGESIPILMSYSHLMDVNKKLKSIICVSQSISDLKKLQEQFIHQATHDYLTDLPNRLLLSDRIEQAIVLSKRNKLTVAILLIDLDRFKYINDSLGHDMGDVLIKAVSDRLTSVLRKDDTVARLGGDEFIVVMCSKNQDALLDMIQRCTEAISEPLQLGRYSLRVTASVGVSLYPKNGREASVLIKNADIALYKAKDSGRNKYIFYSHGMKQKTLQYVNLENDLNTALERDEFEVYYQPLVNPQTLEIEGMEALLRWVHPKHGLIIPDKFINSAESLGIMCPIGEWVLKTACQQQKEWQSKGLPPCTVAVNLSVCQFGKNNYIVDMVKKILQETGINPSYLELEITESTLLKDTKEIRKSLIALKKLGVSLVIDDFGTGYANLNYLKQFPIDKIKIDRTFVQNLTKNLKDAKIVSAIVAMSNTIGMKIIIEGVETEDQLNFLQKKYGNSIYRIQGFYFSEPVEKDEATILLNQGNFLKENTFKECKN